MKPWRANIRAARRLNAETASLLDRLNARLAEKLEKLRQEDETATDPQSPAALPPREEAPR